MKKINMSKKILFLLVMLLIVGVLTSCGQKTTQTTESVLNKTINVGGSTSVESAALKTLDEFVALNPGVTYKYDATGSSTGITNAADGTYSIGFASRELAESEIVNGIEHQVIAMDGIAVALNPGNPVSDISMFNLRAIYKGEITNWAEIGGPDANIIVVSRENGSGTRGAFEELVDYKDNLLDGAIIKDGNGNVANYISKEPNAIGYISFSTLKSNEDKLKSLKIEGVSPTVEDVVNGTYKIARPFNMIYKTTNLNETEIAYIEFLLSEEGQSIIESTGAIKIK